MKYHFCVLGLALLLQQAQCGGLEKELKEIKISLIDPVNELKRTIDATVAELETVKSELAEDKKKLAGNLEEMPAHCKTDNLQLHAKMYASWDLEQCLELTGDWKNGLMLGFKVGIYGANISSMVFKSVTDVLQCQAKNVFKIIPCYYSGIKELISDYSIVKTEVQPFLDEGKQILADMKKDFATCIGVPKQLQDKLEKAMLKCQEVS